MTARRTPLRTLVAASTGALALVPVWLAAPAQAAPITCSASGTTLSVQADNYFYDQRWSIEGGLLTMHDGAAAFEGVQCSVPLSGIDVINVNSDAYADDWVVDLSSDWSGLLLNLPASPYDTVKLDGTSATSPVNVEAVGDGTPYEFDTDGDQVANVAFDGQWGGFRATKGGSGNDAIDLTGLPAQIYTVSVLGGAGADTLIGSDGYDTISGGDGIDHVNGGLNADIIDGDNDNDVLHGGEGADVIHDGPGADTLNGNTPVGEDNVQDTIHVGYDGEIDQIGQDGPSSDKVVFLSDGLPVDAFLDGSPNDGVFGEDNLLGAGAIQTFQGDDTIKADGLTAVDTGAGSDRLILGEHYRNPIGWAAGAGTDTLDASGFDGALLGSFMPAGSQLSTQGTDGFGGTINGNGWEAVLGGLGHDDFGADCACTVIPGPGDDRVSLGQGATFVAGATPDGADTIVVNDGAGEVKADYAGRTTAVSLTIDGEANDGGAGEGDDLDFGITSLTSGAGNDTLAGSTAADVLAGGSGADRILGRGGNDRLTAGPGADTLYGGSGNDVLLGQADADKLYGADGDDVLRGDDRNGPFGNDFLDGGNGDDDLFGYGGNDLFG